MPEIPGFYFDASRNRYFKIVNGDQRHNSAYSNNTVRAADRRKENEDIEDTKRRKASPSQCMTSLMAEKTRHSTDFPNWLVNKKMEAHGDGPEFGTRLSMSPTARKLFSKQAWPFGSDSKILVANDGFLELYDWLECSINGGSPLTTLCLSDEPPYKRLERLEANGEWVFCSYDSILSLSRWTDVNGKIQAVDHSHLLLSSLMQHEHVPNVSTLREELMDPHLFFFKGDALVLLSKNGYQVDVSLHPLRVRSIHKHDFEDTNPLSDSVLSSVRGMLCYNSGKCLVVRATESRRKIWKFNAPVYNYSATVFEHNSTSAHVHEIIRFLIVTARELIVRDIDFASWELVSSDTSIPIRNDNQARPLIYKSGHFVVIEEAEGVFRVINLKRLVSNTVKVDVKLSSPRLTMPRMFELHNEILLSDSQNTYVLGDC